MLWSAPPQDSHDGDQRENYPWIAALASGGHQSTLAKTVSGMACLVTRPEKDQQPSVTVEPAYDSL